MRGLLVAAVALFSCAITGVSAQARVAPRDSAVADTSSRISPGKAFYRSLLIPGWGQASAGAYVRGGTFFALQSASGYMLIKTIGRLSDARGIEQRVETAARDSLIALSQETPEDSARLSDPERFLAALDSTPALVRVRGLINSRREQRQDWITYTIAFTLASGIDAFVAAHLAGFPATVDATPRMDGGANLEVRVPVGRRRQ